MIKYEKIKQLSQLFPEKIAIIDGTAVFSWKEFDFITAKIITFLKKNNLNSEDPVFFLSKNSSHLVFLGAAFSSLGIPFQGIDYNLSTKIVEKLLITLHAGGIFLSDEFVDKFCALKKSVNVLHISSFIEKALNIEEKIKVIENKLPPFKSYSFTSGTTDEPKIVYRSKSFDQRRFDYLITTYAFNQNDVHLVCLPMYHVSATGWMRLFLNLGASVVIDNIENGYHLCDVLSKHKISTTIMSSKMLYDLLVHVDKNSVKHYFDHLKFIITGGKNCPIKTKKEAIEKLGPIIYEYYGTTETGVNTLINSAESLQYLGSVGKTFEGNDIILLGENNEILEHGQQGRIAIHSYMNMADYLNHASEYIVYNERKYLLTSDYGYKNKDGYLFVLQRKKSIGRNAGRLIVDIYGIENHLLKSNFIDEVFVSESANDNSVDVNLVVNKYVPYKHIKAHVLKTSQKHGVNNVVIRVVPALNYTPTGKIKY